MGAKDETNRPISFDDHGDIPFDVPFRDIPPSRISFYFQLSTLVGKKTCRQTCAHCFYITEPEARGRAMDLQEAKRVIGDLQRIGYKVYPMMADSFANNGEFLRLFGNTHVRNYAELGPDGSEVPTQVMERGEMWTSGAPLLDDNWEDLLCTGIEYGFGSVTITFHGVLDGEVQLLPEETYPIKHVFSGQNTEKVIARIHAFNIRLSNGAIARINALPLRRQADQRDPTNRRRPLAVNLGVTIGKHNHTREALLRYVDYFGRLGVSVVRLNCFHDHGGLHPHLVLTPEEVAQVYRDVKWIHEHVPIRFQLGISEDFGTNGIEVMGFPAHVGWCRAGRQLFAIVPEPNEVLREDAEARCERIGSIAACVDAFKPIVGRLLRNIDKSDASITHEIEFFHDVVDALHQKRIDGTYSDGCYAPELLTDLRRAEGASDAAARRRLQVVPV